MKFTYSSGQQPLDGYTIKRGIGRGGFGEVYYALSEGGKEVALKLVCRNLDVELRGMSQCLNLKHPNLVGLYDMRTSGDGDHWVIMEYITGESLSSILKKHPEGLPPELARQYFLGIAAAVAYLHDHGIVHRDLKPGNIFVEHEVIKIGDYGLSKFMGGSQYTGQTQSVGTVHYMAPEIASGNYNRQIDIYAAGIILYEMLTGQVPFDGESVGEILMKHLTTTPDLGRVPDEFVPILRKALAKNPKERYASISEMSRDVAAVGQEEKVSQVGPPEVMPGGESIRTVEPEPVAVATTVPMRKRVSDLAAAMLLAAGLAGLFSTLWAVVTQSLAVSHVATYFFLTLGCCWAILIPAHLWTKKSGDSWMRRVVLMSLGLLVGVEALWLDGYTMPTSLGEARANEVAVAEVRGRSPGVFPQNEGLPIAARYLSYFALVFFAMRWWKVAERERPQRFSMAPVLATGFWAYIFLFLLPASERQIGFVVLVLAAVIVQLASPWQKPKPARARRLRLRYA